MFDLSKCPRDKNGSYLAQTRDGKPVTLICAAGRGMWPLIGYIGDASVSSSWDSNGKYDPDMLYPERDLFNIPEPKRSGEVWIVVFDDGTSQPKHYTYDTNREHLDQECDILCRRGLKILARFSHKWTEGEGMDGK